MSMSQSMLAPSRAVARGATRRGIRRTLFPRPQPVHRNCLHQSHRRNGRVNLPSGQVTTSQTASPSRYWPKKEIPEGAAQLTYRPKEAQDDAVTISWSHDHLTLQDAVENEAQRTLKPATLRDSCTCTACKDPSSGQKSFASIEIPTDIGISSVRATGPGLAITFANDIARFAAQGHEMVLPWSQVQNAVKHRPADESSLSRRHAILCRTGVQYWDARTLDKHVRKIDYAEFMKPDSAAFWDVVIDILRLGIVYLRNVPRDENSVVNITTRIANIRETFYGRTFDVRAKPNAENVAYTSGYLGLHQDLCYLAPPPMIQALHCMDNSCSGGESLFSDGERAGRLLWPFANTSLKIAPLAEHLVPYQYDKHGYFYHAKRTVIDHDEDGFAGVYWSPPFQGRYENTSVDLKDWIEPARIFEGLINHKDAVHSYKMAEGECVLFDNLRTMHGRNAFDAAAGGSRWLRGAYIAAEDFLSRAAYIPAGQAEMYRGSEEWSSENAQRDLREGEWYADVVRRVKEVDDSVEG